MLVLLYKIDKHWISICLKFLETDYLFFILKHVKWMLDLADSCENSVQSVFTGLPKGILPSPPKVSFSPLSSLSAVLNTDTFFWERFLLLQGELHFFEHLKHKFSNLSRGISYCSIEEMPFQAMLWINQWPEKNY